MSTAPRYWEKVQSRAGYALVPHWNRANISGKRMMRRLSLPLGFLLLAASFEVAEARNVALVVGNDAYTNVPGLQKAVNDARAVGSELERLGFVVRRVENVDQRAM